MRKCVAEESADAQRHVHAGSAEMLERDNLNPFKAARLRVPGRLDAQQSKRLSDIVAVGAHL